MESGTVCRSWYISRFPPWDLSAVMQISAAFSVSEICMNLAGFPSTDNAALTWVTHAYDYGMVRFEMGYACAITVVLFLVMIAVNNVIQRLINRHAES